MMIQGFLPKVQGTPALAIKSDDSEDEVESPTIVYSEGEGVMQ